jgi:surface polysaccharide O-acyltransferase-like enzyme
MLQKERNSSFELLRIISMVLIVSFHCVYHADFDFTAPFSPRLYFIQCIDMGGKNSEFYAI